MRSFQKRYVMLVTTTENVPGHTVRASLGQVFGVVVVRAGGWAATSPPACDRSSAGRSPNIPG